MSTTRTGEAEAGLSAPLDLLLTQAALGTAPPRLSIGTTARLMQAIASAPGQLAVRSASVVGELARIGAGVSRVAPSRRDRRFSDPAWTGNPMLRRTAQAYLATSQAVEGLIQELPLEWADADRVSFVLTNLIEALAPSNNPLTSPAAWKAAIDTGGLSAIRGIRALVADLSAPPRVPSMVDRGAFRVGKDLATTPGAASCELPSWS